MRELCPDPKWRLCIVKAFLEVWDAALEVLHTEPADRKHRPSHCWPSWIGNALVKVKVIGNHRGVLNSAQWVGQQDGICLFGPHVAGPLGEALVLGVVAAVREVRPARRRARPLRQPEPVRLVKEVIVDVPTVTEFIGCLDGKPQRDLRDGIGVGGVIHWPGVLVRAHDSLEVERGATAPLHARLVEACGAVCQRQAHVAQPLPVAGRVPILPCRQRDIAADVLLVAAPRPELAAPILHVQAGVRGLPGEHEGLVCHALLVPRRAVGLVRAAAVLGLLLRRQAAVEAVLEQRPRRLRLQHQQHGVHPGLHVPEGVP
mmetsp:Transcript_8181/g.25243  ORF Transcript_8181/g.25243 Transcript_8181/m.25243 type:complete len:316 (-) Transcript_8181:141-1088(-)